MAAPLEFLQEVRSEASKVVWPARREVMITTGLVLLLAAFASSYFTVVDWALERLVYLVLGFGRHG